MANPENNEDEQSDQVVQRPDYPPEIHELIKEGKITLSTLSENPLLTEDDM